MEERWAELGDRGSMEVGLVGSGNLADLWEGCPHGFGGWGQGTKNSPVWRGELGRVQP